MVRHHLLLPEVATRRDLSDEGTIRFVADRISTPRHAAADGRAGRGRLAGHRTGGVEHVEGRAVGRAGLAGRAPARRQPARATPSAATFPTPEQLARLAEGRRIIEGLDDQLLVIAPDRPGLFSRVAAALALNGLDVLSAAARTDEGMALETYRVESNFGPVIPWDRVIGDVEKALDGRLALEARLRERAHVYANRSQRRLAQRADGHLRQRPVRRGHRGRGPRARRGGGALPHHPGHRRSRPRHPLGQGADLRPRRASTPSTCRTATATRSPTPTTCTSWSGRSSPLSDGPVRIRRRSRPAGLE